MSDYFVSKVGLDVNTGLAGFPWLTVDHALTNIPLTGGPHTLSIGTGTYDETNGGATGSLKFGRLYGTLLSIFTTTGTQDVIIRNATAADGFMMQNTAALSNMLWTNIRFTAITGSTQCWYWRNLLSCTNLSFTSCIFDAPPDAGAMQCIFTVGGNGAATHTITFTSCTFNHATGSSGYSINMNTGTGPQTTTITLTNCTVSSNFHGVLFDGAAMTVNVSGGTFACTGLNATALIFGNDTPTSGKGVTGSCYGATISSTQGHAFEIGDIASGVVAAGNIIIGGDYPVVMKTYNQNNIGGANNVFVNNRISGGTLASILFKGYDNSKCSGNTILASAAPALKDWDSGPTAGFVNINVTARGNRAIITGTGKVHDWQQLNGAGTQVDGGGNVVDYNTYDVRAGTLGDINLVLANATLAAAQAAWNTVAIDVGNDLHSQLAASQTLMSTHYTATGSYLYMFITNNAGLYWNVGTAAFETYTAANVSLYAMPMIEDSVTYTYTAVFPLLIPAGNYTARYFVRAGAVPAGSDTQVNGDAQVSWTGRTRTFAGANGGGGGGVRV